MKVSGSVSGRRKSMFKKMCPHDSPNIKSIFVTERPNRTDE